MKIYKGKGNSVKELKEIQQELKAPKGQYNSFSKFNYRSCEDILNALKPLLKKHNVCLVITDSIENIGDRNYVKATVTFSVVIDGKVEKVVVTASAREALTKKGMDEAQITGAASSYARKYALNGLFLIDDTKDADSMDNRENSPQKPPTSSKKGIEDKDDIPETESMNERSAHITEMFESSKDLKELEKHAASFREEINTKMSKGFRDWLKENYDSVKSKLEAKDREKK